MSITPQQFRAGGSAQRYARIDEFGHVEPVLLGLGGSVTQITSADTPVTLNALTGTVTTVSLTTAAGVAQPIVVNNEFVNAGSAIIANIIGYSGSGTNGAPSVFVDSIAQATFQLIIFNNAVGSRDPLAGKLTIAFIVLN